MVDLHMHWPVVPYVDFSFDFLVHPPGLFWSIDPPGYLLEGGESCLTRGKMGAIRPRWAPSERSRIESIAMATGGWEAATCAAGVQKSERPAVGEQVACV